MKVRVRHGKNWHRIERLGLNQKHNNWIEGCHSFVLLHVVRFPFPHEFKKSSFLFALADFFFIALSILLFWGLKS
jgi:hypothetical protein